jgi:hypothetical protein
VLWHAGTLLSRRTLGAKDNRTLGARVHLELRTPNARSRRTLGAKDNRTLGARVHLELRTPNARSRRTLEAKDNRTLGAKDNRRLGAGVRSEQENAWSSGEQNVLVRSSTSTTKPHLAGRTIFECGEELGMQ